MSYNLFLDDERCPKDALEYMHLPIFGNIKWSVVRNYYAFISIIEGRGIPEIISFDHDLADEHYKKQNFDYKDDNTERTGYHCAKWLIDYCIDNNHELPKQIIVHSMNPYGSMNIKSLFDSYCKAYEIKPYNIPLNPYFRK